MAEVQECRESRGARPVEWLLANVDVGPRWCLVHATHLDEKEIRGIAASGATVAICTTTEANLGDGLFPLPEYLKAGGRFGVGSDSNTSVSPVEELRWLEYGQRLRLRRRNIVVGDAQPSVGALLLRHAVDDGWRVTGFADGASDSLRLDAQAPALASAAADDLADRFVFGGNRNLVDEVTVAGETVVKGGRHHRAEDIAESFRRAMRRLLND
jgi:formimidoylglutamate deiminase